MVFFNNDIQASLLIILNLILIESLLSVDNAAVLATMVMDLPKEQRRKALKYGILGAYFFRGICLIFAYWLVNIWWLKPLGGIYLLYLSFSYFKGRIAEKQPPEIKIKNNHSIKNFLSKSLSPFWTTVIMVEVMDLAFSLDNVFAAVAFTNNIVLIIIGVFIGILAMRFVAQFFVRLMETFNFLGTAAFVVIALLGFKLLVPEISKLFFSDSVGKFFESEKIDLLFSVITVSVFFFPLATSILFNFPSRRVNK